MAVNAIECSIIAPVHTLTVPLCRPLARCSDRVRLASPTLEGRPHRSLRPDLTAP
jgi:hypothetical protein